jgi:hypothetical protein
MLDEGHQVASRSNDIAITFATLTTAAVQSELWAWEKTFLAYNFKAAGAPAWPWIPTMLRPPSGILDATSQVAVAAYGYSTVNLGWITNTTAADGSTASPADIVVQYARQLGKATAQPGKPDCGKYRHGCHTGGSHACCRALPEHHPAAAGHTFCHGRRGSWQAGIPGCAARAPASKPAAANTATAAVAARNGCGGTAICSFGVTAAIPNGNACARG